MKIREQVVVDTGVSKTQAFNAADRAIKRILLKPADAPK
jgi:hypothetical protein